MIIMHIIWNSKGATKTIVLAAIFAILLAVTIVQRSQRKVVEKEQKEIEEAPLVANFNPDDVYTIEIHQLLTKTILRKSGDQWVVGAAQIMPNYSDTEKKNTPVTAVDKADSNAIREVLETIKNGLSGDIVSRNRDKKIEYRVGILGSKFSFQNEKGEEIACLDVGDKSKDFSGTYVSVCGKDEVYKVPGMLDYIFKSDVNGWRDKHVQDLDKSKIVKVDATGTGIQGAFSVMKGQDGKWALKSPVEKVADENVLDTLLTRISTYEASGFPERMMPDDKISQIDLIVTATMEDNKTYTLTFGSSQMAPEKLVQGSEYGIIYTAGYSDVDAITKQINMVITGEEAHEEHTGETPPPLPGEM